MNESQLFVVIQMMCAELGYTFKWVSLLDKTHEDVFSLDNGSGDCELFSRDEKYEKAWEWLRKRV